jgi:ABC-type multidrug transport system fused ATPase/permease subunit
MDSEGRLSRWFAVWHPRYRATMIFIGCLSACAAVLIYLENTALESFGAALRRAAGVDVPAKGGISGLLRPMAPLGVLIVFGLVRLTRLVSDAIQRITVARMQHRARSDLEAAVLAHLLRKEDSFFASRPPAEILNRLSTDIARINNRRVAGGQRRQALFIILGNLYFFAVADIRLTIAALLTVAAGAWWMRTMTSPVAAADKLSLSQEDRIKARFEDLLRAAPEIQVGNLGDKAVRQLTDAQVTRGGILARFWRVDMLLNFVMGLSNLIALTSLLLVTIYYLSGGVVTTSLALVPVILKALPEMFNSAAQLAVQGLTLQYAETSARRLLEYETEPEPKQAKDVKSDVATLELANATYQYTLPDGRKQGGVVDVSLRFDRGTWISIIGGAGAGKSTVMQLLLGRTRPERGTVKIDGTDLSSLSGAQRGAILSFMPQTVVVLDGTIRENLYFGAEDAMPKQLAPEDLSILAESGLATLCRIKALDRQTGRAVPEATKQRVLDARARVAERLAAAGLERKAFQESTPAPHFVVDAMLGGRSDPTVLELLLDRKRTVAPLRKLATAKQGEVLQRTAKRLLEDSRALLSQPTVQAYNKLAAIPLDEKLWQLRTQTLPAIAQSPLPATVALDLLTIALTASWGELATPPARSELQGAPVDGLRHLLADQFAPFESSGLHPYLTWRENLVFGCVDAPNQRVEQEVQRVVDEVVEQMELGPTLVDVGLEYHVGRGGAKLSGGQRQLITLCRTLMRRRPIVVLDEPTSALDPASRSRVAAMLKSWKSDRIIITVTHDMELARESDDIYRFESGRYVEPTRAAS